MIIFLRSIYFFLSDIRVDIENTVNNSTFFTSKGSDLKSLKMNLSTSHRFKNNLGEYHAHIWTSIIHFKSFRADFIMEALFVRPQQGH